MLCCPSVPVALQKYIHNVAVLVNSPPKIVLLPLNLDEDFVEKESIAVTLVPAPKSPRVLRAEIDTPQPDRLVADPNTTLGHNILDVTAAQTKAMIEPDNVLNDLRREPVSFVQR